MSRATFENVVIAVVAAFIPVARYAVKAPLLRGVWAEDGPVFLTDAFRGARSILYSYAGYGHLLPRLISFVAAALPVPWFPAFVVTSYTLLAIVGGLVIVASADSLRLPRAAKVLAASGFFLLPGYGGGLLLAICNLHWMLTYSCLWLVAARLRSNWSWAWLTLVSLTTPLIVFLIPVAIWPRADRRWTWRYAVITCTGLAFHLLCFVLPSQSIANPDSDRHPSISLALIRTVVRDMSVATANLGSVWLSFVSALITAAIIAFAIWRSPRRHLALSIVFAGVSFATVLSVTSGRSTYRYATTGVAMVIGAGAIAIGTMPATRRFRALLIAAVVLPFATGFPATSHRVDVPSWSAEAARARRACERGASKAHLSTGDGWIDGVTIPCSALTK